MHDRLQYAYASRLLQHINLINITPWRAVNKKYINPAVLALCYQQSPTTTTTTTWHPILKKTLRWLPSWSFAIICQFILCKIPTLTSEYQDFSTKKTPLPFHACICTPTHACADRHGSWTHILTHKSLWRAQITVQQCLCRVMAASWLCKVILQLNFLAKSSLSMKRSGCKVFVLEGTGSLQLQLLSCCCDNFFPPRRSFGL